MSNVKSKDLVLEYINKITDILPKGMIDSQHQLAHMDACSLVIYAQIRREADPEKRKLMIQMIIHNLENLI